MNQRPLSDSEWSAGAWSLHEELVTQRLEVVLREAPRPMFHGHMIRGVDGRNPKWYRRLCAEHTCDRRRPRNHRKHDTKIRRRETERCLERIAKRIVCICVYHVHLLPLVERRALLLRDECPR